MAKKKADKTGTPKLPKRIGGVKLTKELRKAGGALLEQARSPVGRELIAAGLSMAAAAAATAAKRERDRRAAPKDAGDATAAASPAPAKPASGKADPHDIGVVLGTLAQEALGRMFAGKAKL